MVLSANCRRGGGEGAVSLQVGQQRSAENYKRERWLLWIEIFTVFALKLLRGLPLSFPSFKVPINDDNLCDLLLAEKCLAGDEGAAEELMRKFRPSLLAFLTGAGAEIAEAEEVLQAFWADAFSSSPEHQPVLRSYRGDSALGTWLKRATINRLYNLKKQSQRRARTFSPLQVGDPTDPKSPQPEPAGPVEGIPDHALYDLMRAALLEAFRKCPSEHFVQMQLRFCDGLRNEELARIWNCHPSKMSRSLEDACKTIARETQLYIASIDPWLKLTWSDFVEMCLWARPDEFDLGATA